MGRFLPFTEIADKQIHVVSLARQMIVDGFVKSPISALSFILHQKIFWRRMHLTAGLTPVLRIVANSSGAARLDLELFTLPPQF